MRKEKLLSFTVHRGISPALLLSVSFFSLTVQAGTLFTGRSHSVALRADGVVLTWGSNMNGALGTGSADSANTPQTAKHFAQVKSVAAGSNHTLALKHDGTVWGWGKNDYGQLGSGDISSSSIPVQTQYLSDITHIAAGCSFSLALKNDKTVWSWGNNDSGQLGLTGGSKSAPLKIAGLNDVVAIAAGCDTSYALKSDGSVWAWGSNSQGQLGDGTTTSSITPKKVTGLSAVTSLAAGSAHGMALTSTGQVYSWGSNHNCQLGHTITGQYNYCNNTSTPTEVAEVRGAVKIAATDANSYVLKSDATVWAWGRKSDGQLGDGSEIDPANSYYSRVFKPVQVKGLTDIEELSSGLGDHILAKHKSGAVFAWGLNRDGQLGNAGEGSRVDYWYVASSLPVQVLGAGGDGWLNLNSNTASSSSCKPSVSTASGLLLNVPCVEYGGSTYVLDLMFDPSVSTGTYFKLNGIR